MFKISSPQLSTFIPHKMTKTNKPKVEINFLKRGFIYLGKKTARIIVFGLFLIIGVGVTLATFGGSLLPYLGLGLDADNNPVASMHTLDEITRTTTGAYDRDTDSLEAISGKLDTLLGL